MSTTVLTVPEGSEGYVVYSEPPRKGWGCVLTQHGNVTNASRRLKNYEQKYPTHDLE